MVDQRIRVYLMDEHELVRLGIRAAVGCDATIEVIGEAAMAAAGLHDVLTLEPDVVILDSELPDRSGVEVCREIRALLPGTRVLMLTQSDDADTISQAILAGASGYVLKRIESQSLISGLHLVAGGHSLIDPTVAARVVEQMESQRRSMDVVADLTPQQRRIFFLIAEGLTNRQIAERLYLAEKTVKNHVTGLLARLGLEHRTQAALLAVRIQRLGASAGAVASATDPARRQVPRPVTTLPAPSTGAAGPLRAGQAV